MAAATKIMHIYKIYIYRHVYLYHRRFFDFGGTFRARDFARNGTEVVYLVLRCCGVDDELASLLLLKLLCLPPL